MPCRDLEPQLKRLAENLPGRRSRAKKVAAFRNLETRRKSEKLWPLRNRIFLKIEKWVKIRGSKRLYFPDRKSAETEVFEVSQLPHVSGVFFGADFRFEVRKMFRAQKAPL